MSRQRLRYASKHSVRIEWEQTCCSPRRYDGPLDEGPGSCGAIKRSEVLSRLPSASSVNLITTQDNVVGKAEFKDFKRSVSPEAITY
jgi:hypothetical protein